MTVKRFYGLNGARAAFGSSFEGIRDRNYVGTNLISPLLQTRLMWLLANGVDIPLFPLTLPGGVYERLSYYRR